MLHTCDVGEGGDFAGRVAGGWWQERDSGVGNGGVGVGVAWVVVARAKLVKKEKLQLLNNQQ